MNKSVKVKVNGIHCFPPLPLARPAAHYSRQPKSPIGAPVCFDQDVQHSPIRQISLLAVQSNAVDAPAMPSSCPEQRRSNPCASSLFSMCVAAVCCSAIAR